MTIHTPIASRSRGLPPWAAVLSVFLLLVGAFYFASNLSGTNPALAGGPLASGSAQPSGGGAGDATVALAIIKKAGCQACHGPNLEGQANFPSLHGLQGGPSVANLQQLGKDHPDDWMQLWIAGTDPAVASIDRMAMPKFGEGQLTADEIDTIVGYLKTLQ